MNGPSHFPGSGLRHRITLQQPVLTSDGAGGYTRAWVDVVDLWASITPAGAGRVADHETLQDRHLQSHTLFKFAIRYYAGLTPDMRISYESRLFNIRAITDPDESKTNLQLLAEEGVGD